jgi:hypothetical protein
MLQIVVAGVVAGDVLSVVDSSGVEVVRAPAGSRSRLRASVLVPPGGDKDMTVFLNPDEAARQAVPEAGESARIGLRQTVLLSLGSIALPGRCVRVLPSRLEGGRGLMVVLNDGIVAYNVDTPSRPLPAGTWQIDGVRGALEWHGQLVYFGDEGIGAIDRRGRRQTAAPADGAAGPVLDAAADPDWLYALTAQGLDVYSRDFRKQGAVTMDGGRSVVRVGHSLAVGGEYGVGLFDTAAAPGPRRTSQFDDVQGTSVLHPLPMEPGSFLATLADGTAKSFQPSEGSLEETAGYARTPWFAESIRLGTVLVTIGEGRAKLDLYRFGPTQVT